MSSVHILTGAEPVSLNVVLIMIAFLWHQTVSYAAPAVIAHDGSHQLNPRQPSAAVTARAGLAALALAARQMRADAIQIALDAVAILRVRAQGSVPPLLADRLLYFDHLAALTWLGR